jgi:pimeloyl-ACP methyl ester carboxylesterase
MTYAPETRYTRSADGTNLAYRVSGDGPIDLVFLHGITIPLDLLWDDPGFIRVQKRLSTFSRTIWFDRRGLGASEGDQHDSLAEEFFDADITAVLNAAGSERPALVAEGTSGGRVIHYSATHPDRVRVTPLDEQNHYELVLPGIPGGRCNEASGHTDRGVAI